jgi:VCBS repeat-containing protein
VIDPDGDGLGTGEAGEDAVLPGTVVTQVENSTGDVELLVDGSATIAGLYGELVIQSNGDYSYTAYGDRNSVAQSEEFTYTISDGTHSDTAILTIEISGERLADDTAMAGIKYAYVVEDVAEADLPGGKSTSWPLSLGGTTTLTGDSFSVAANTTQDMVLGLNVANALGVANTATLTIETGGAGNWEAYATYNSGSLLSLLGSGGSGDILVPNMPAGDYRFVLKVQKGTSVAGSASFQVKSVTVSHLDQYETDQVLPVSGNLFENDVFDTANNLETLSISADAGIIFTEVGVGTTLQGEYGTLAVNADGSYTYTPDAALVHFTAPVDDVFTYQVTFTDGTTEQASLTVTLKPSGAGISEMPFAPIVDIGDGNDFITADEINAENKVTVTIQLPATAEADDTIRGLGEDIILTEADITAKQVAVTVATPDEGESLSVSVVLIDSAGNKSYPGTATAIVDTTAPSMPIVAIGNDDDFITADEIVGGKVTLTVTLPDNAAVGDTVNGLDKVITLTQANLDAGQVTGTLAAPAEGETLEASVTLTDRAGNTSVPGTAEATVDTTAPAEPTIETEIDGAVVVTPEADDTTEVSIVYTDENGDEQTVVVTKGSDDTWSADSTDVTVDPVTGVTTIPTDQVDTSKDVTATAKDPAGNTAEATQNGDTEAPGQPTVIIGNGDNYITADEIDTNNKVTLTVELPTNAVAGDTLTGLGDPIVLDDADITAGQVSGAVAAPADGETLHVVVSITDTAGNVGPDGTAIATVDTEAPTLTITTPIAGDDVVNIIEAAAGFAVTGTGTAGDLITLTNEAGQKIGTTTVTPENTWSIAVDATHIAAMGQGSETLTATAKDPAGNTTVKIAIIMVDSEIIAGADNLVDFQLTAVPLSTDNPNPGSLNKTGFTVVGAGLGPVLGAGVIDNVIKNSVQFNVDENQVREVTVYADAGGVTVGTMNLNLYKMNETTREWELQSVKENWVTAVLGGKSKDTDFVLDEGQWMFVMSGGLGLAILTGYTLKFTSDTTLDYANATSISGAIPGNILIDNDSNFSYDELPAGTILASVNSTAVSESGTTNIVAEHGTLTVRANGSYDYQVDPDFRGPYGYEEVFTYKAMSPKGSVISATLTIQLNIFPIDKQVKIDENLIVDIEPTVTLDTAESVIKNAVGFAVLELSAGSSSVLDLNLLGGKPPLEFTVGENQVRELTLHGSAGGLEIAKTYSMAVYKLDENTDNYVQIHFQENWFNAPLFGGASGPLTLKFGEGDYKAILLTAGGIGALSGNGLYVDHDKIYDYNTPFKFTGLLEGDVTPEAGTVLLKVGEEWVDPDSITPLTFQGQYGELNISADGTYSYSVATSADPAWKPPYGAVESFRLVTLDAEGKAAVETLNIKVATHTAVNDFNDVSVAEQNTVTTIKYDERDKAGNYGDSYSKEFEVAEHSAAAPVTIKATASSANIALAPNVIITYTLLNTTTGENFIKTVEGTKESATLNKSLVDLPAGQYELTVTTNKGNLQSIYFESTVIHSEKYTPTAINPVTGALLQGAGNDQGTQNIAELKVGTQTVFVSDPNKGAESIKIEGLYGTLIVDKNGDYSYLPNGEKFGIETFAYETTSVIGIKEAATLEINVGQAITASEHADIAVSSAADDVFTMGDGADTVSFENLGGLLEGGNGNNGLDEWTDYDSSQGDVIDLTELLDGEQTEVNLDGYLKYADGKLQVDRNGGGDEFEDLLVVADAADTSVLIIWGDIEDPLYNLLTSELLIG